MLDSCKTTLFFVENMFDQFCHGPRLQKFALERADGTAHAPLIKIQTPKPEDSRKKPPVGSPPPLRHDTPDLISI